MQQLPSTSQGQPQPQFQSQPQAQMQQQQLQSQQFHGLRYGTLTPGIALDPSQWIPILQLEGGVQRLGVFWRNYFARILSKSNAEGHVAADMLLVLDATAAALAAGGAYNVHMDTIARTALKRLLIAKMTADGHATTVVAHFAEQVEASSMPLWVTTAQKEAVRISKALSEGPRRKDDRNKDRDKDKGKARVSKDKSKPSK